MAIERRGKVVRIDLEREMRRSYLDYAMSVIVDRALPDVRDGLKPVQRRILYAMQELGLTPNRPHRKSARIVGEVMGKYHPHGDMAIYDAMVRMAQDFSYRYPLVDGHGNFGSVDGDPPAAMRYTEARLAPVAMHLLQDIDKETVDFVPNFDGSLEQPAVLPSRFPNLLVNGQAGIAVGMATNIPPHNLGEVVDALVRMIDDPEVPTEELLAIIKGPDFPTGAFILGTDGIRETYATGRGHIKVRARAEIEVGEGGRARIAVSELPYLVNKAALIERIAELVREKKIDGITDLRDESDRHGLRVVIELRRDVKAQVVLNQLFKHTALQETFGAILLALVDGEPRILTLREMLRLYLDHQREVVTRRSRYELNKAEERAHVLEGLRIALDHIDAVIELIRRAPDEAAAREGLMSRFGLTEKQATAILEMQLRRLTGLEREKLEAEYRELLEKIAWLREILGDERKLFGVIRRELLEIREKFADARRTQIIPDDGEFAVEDLVADEEIVVTLTHRGYIKRLPVSTYRSQRRGGRGITALTTVQEDFVEHLFVTSNHSSVLFFTDRGRVYRLKGHEIPEAGRAARGTSIVNLIPLDTGETVQSVIPIREFDADHFLLMVTGAGVVKKTELAAFDSPRAGLIGIALDDGDTVVSVVLTDGQRELVAVTRLGQAIRFPEAEVRPTGRAARGVRGIRLAEGDRVVAADVVDPGADLLVVTEKGFGKRTPLAEYRLTARGGKGIRTASVTDKNGPIVGAFVVREDQELMLVTGGGVMIRMPVAGISRLGRSTVGVKLVRLDTHDRVAAVARLAAREEQEEGAG